MSLSTLYPGRLAPGSRFWCEARDGDALCRAVYHRHYSRHVYRDGRKPKKIIGPGFYRLLITPCEKAVFGWRKFIDACIDQRTGRPQAGVNNCIFRNEDTDRLPSVELIRDAVALAWERWPGERLYTYVNPEAVKSRNPGYCYKLAGWRRCGYSADGLHVLEYLPPSHFPYQICPLLSRATRPRR